MAQTWAEELRSRGFRVTPQRRLILDAVRDLDHATPDAIREHTGQGIDLSTIYRTLDALERSGLVTHTHLGQGTAYHLAEHADHLHLVCRGCGAVSDIPLSVASSMVAELRDSHAFDADARHLTVFGRCRECSTDQ
ncbi:transcriptional repressor [Spiractinospora alimapuensis]|uniref:Fur family transcriptional regulator n=1 Tax=Spiractinospora alimapuensis TaxID=2820884 RepID=UPI001F403E39|nr:Fur family transcriptional regulator [Spiractinospora alimapuensis]QVQ50784.1 transcriptional repressor [Spiractinospora alimapuensis]